jgi:uncharacterized membrane protein YeaQ/YmgE (transglycosylase-associated protein family)
LLGHICHGRGAFGMSRVTGLNIYSLLVAVAGAVVMLFGYHAITGRTGRASRL